MSNTPSVISMATPTPVMTSPSLSSSSTAVKHVATITQAPSTAVTVTQGAGQLLLTGMGLGGANLTTVAGLNPTFITPSQLTQGWASRALWDGNIKMFYCIALFFICVFRFQSLEYFSLTNGKLYRFIPLYILKACSYFIHTGLYDILTPKSNVFFCLLTVFSDLWSDENRNTESPKTFNMTTKSNMNFEPIYVLERMQISAWCNSIIPNLHI